MTPTKGISMVRRFFLRVAVFTLLTTAPAIGPQARADDWPTWRHDRLRTGVTSTRVDPPLEQVWAFRSRQARLAPKPKHSPHQAKYPWLTWYTLPISAAGDGLFFNSAADGRTVCLDAATGKVRWEFVAGAAVNRTPMIWEDKVYVGSDDGHAYCLDAKTGTLVWKFKAAPADRWLLAYGKPVSVWPIRTDVLVDDGVAYFGAGVFPHDGTFCTPWTHEPAACSGETAPSAKPAGAQAWPRPDICSSARSRSGCPRIAGAISSTGARWSRSTAPPAGRCEPPPTRTSCPSGPT